MDWGSILAVVFTGLIIVFSALVGLVLVLFISGRLVPLIEKIGKKNTEAPAAAKAAPVPAAAAAAPAPVPFTPPAGPGPVAEAAVEDGIPGKTVAAISAAVTVALEGQGTYAIRSIRRSEKK